MQTCFTASGEKKEVMQISIHAVTLSTDLKLQRHYTHLTLTKGVLSALCAFVFGAAFFTVDPIKRNIFISSFYSF